ncbi:MAG: zinc-ribbon domain-containing protein [Oscillospiraceae bacterium]|nr:zinc-ribbon domain-containing protein [Oscillospiraceae bacterium]
MKCSNCGRECSEHAVFCKNCGTKLHADIIAPQPVVQEPVIPQPVIQEPVIPQPVVQEPVIQQPVPVQKQPTAAKRAKRAKRGIPRILRLLAAFVFVMTYTGLIVALMLSKLDTTANTIRYQFMEFSISMPSELVPCAAKYSYSDQYLDMELEIGGSKYTIPMSRYLYADPSNDFDLYFMAFTSVYKPIEDELDAVKNHSGEMLYQIVNKQFATDQNGTDEGFQIKDGMIQFQKAGNQKPYYFYGKEMIANGRIYCFCFVTIQEMDQQAKTWLSSVSLNRY